MLPPTSVCIDPACLHQRRWVEHIPRPRELTEALTYPVTIFTNEFGAVPGHSTSLYCRSTSILGHLHFELKLNC
jgi:hypothetical protein